MINVGVVAAVLAAGKAADRYGERRIIGYGTASCGVLVLAVHFTDGFLGLLVVFLLLGIPVATGTPAGTKAVAGWFPDRERGTAMGNPADRDTPWAALSPPSRCRPWGWSTAGAWRCPWWARPRWPPGFWCCSFTGNRSAPADRRGGARSGPQGTRPARGCLGGAFYAAVLAGCQWCYISYIELYLTEDIFFSLVFAAGLLAVGQACGGAGRIGFGLVSDRVFYGRRVPVLVMLALLGAAAGIATAFLSPGMPVWLVAVVASLLGLGTMSWQGLYLALVSKIVGPGVAGVAIGMTNTVTFAGVVVLPPIFGLIADQTQSYEMAWIAMAIAITLPIPFLLRVREEGA